MTTIWFTNLIGDSNILDVAVGLTKSMEAIRMRRSLGIFVSLLLLWSQATADSIRAQLPADVTIKGAGRGTWLIVRLTLDGQELPFIVDTGSPITLFDKSLEPKLGKRLNDATFTSPAGGRQESGVYIAPKI